jgi:hypothetical protein
MSDTEFPGTAGTEEAQSELFAQMVLQQANLAMMLLGKFPHPKSGKVTQDLEGARLFIDQLEMLEVKTKGNLNKAEEKLLKQSLMSLQLAFVEAVQSSGNPPAATDAGKVAETATAPTAPEGQPPSTAGDDAGKKKFSKKY